MSHFRDSSMARPSQGVAAIDFVDSFLAIAGIDMPELGRDRELTANEITDAWIAAAVRTPGSHLVMFDRGFTRLLGRTELMLLEPVYRAAWHSLAIHPLALQGARRLLTSATGGRPRRDPARSWRRCASVLRPESSASPAPRRPSR